MPTNNTFIMMGLAMAGLWFMNRQRGSQEDQVDQLTGAAMMASGEGTAPDAPFQSFSGPADPVFFFNQGGQMTKVPGAPLPSNVRSGEDIGKHPGGGNPPELEFEIEKGVPAPGTSDDSPINPAFSGDAQNVFPSTIWNDQAAIAVANAMPLLAIQDAEGGGIEIVGSNVDIATLSSKEQFRAVSFSDPTGDITGGFTTTGEVLAEYVRGFNTSVDEFSSPVQPPIPDASTGDEDIGQYPGVGNPPELEFEVARSAPPIGTTDISPTTPQFAGTGAVNVTPATIWDAQASPPIAAGATWFDFDVGHFAGDEGGSFGPSARETIREIPQVAVWETGVEFLPIMRQIDYIGVDPAPPAWAGGDNWWDEG